MAESIFINYRRGEDQAAAGRLYDQLEAAFTRERIFIDVDNIAPGRDFTEELATRVEQCDVFLAVIGRRWADVVDVDGSRRLDNPNDWVRVEIESAQRLGKHIIPVLVDGAEMPRPEKLPDALQPFARRNAARLTHERFRADVQALVVAIGRLREAERARLEAERLQTPRIAATLAVSAQGAGEAAAPAAAGRRIAPMAIAALAALAVIAAGAGFFVWRSSSPSPVATDSIAKRADAGAPSIANPAPTKIAAALPTSTPAAAAATEPATPAASPLAKASADASPSREAKVKTDEARPTPSAAPTVVASSTPTLEPTPASTVSAASEPTPPASSPVAAASSAAPPHEATLKPVEAQPTPAVAATPAPAAPAAGESTPPVSIALAKASPAAPPPHEAKLEAVEAQPTPSAAPTVAPAAAPAAAATPPANPLATPTPDAPPPTPAALPASEPQVALAAPAAKPAATDLAALTPLVAAELRRLGCYDGAATGWDAVDLRLGVDKFAELAKLATLPAEPDLGLLAALKSEPDHFCAPQCSPREAASDGRCVPKTCGANQVLTRDGACVARQPKPQTTAAARAPAAGKRCFTFNGSSYCE